jgi:cell wall-associated NlpC family hydrolase
MPVGRMAASQGGISGEDNGIVGRILRGAVASTALVRQSGQGGTDITGKASGIGRRFIPFLLACAVIALVIAGIAWAETPAINTAKTQAEALQAQIDALDAQVEAAVEEYDTANANLEQTQAAADDNEKKLTAVEADLEQAKAKLSARIVEIYKSGHLGVIDTLVGSASFGDLINRINLMERLSKQDSELVAQVTDYQKDVTSRKAELQKQLADETQYKADSAAAEKNVEAQLAAKKTALKGKEAQIAQLEKDEAARQAALAAAARKAAADALKAQQAAAQSTTTATHKTTTTTQKTTATTNHTGATGGGTPTTKRTTTTAERATTTTTDSPPSGGTTGDDVVAYALNFLGTAYVWGGSTPSGFDCSGFAMYVYRHFGISLPHSSSIQAGYGVAVSRDNLQPGDLVFFFSPIHHVGIYIGGGKMVDAAGTGKGVRIDYLWSSYNCGRRIL